MHQASRGFTIVELLVTMVVAGILTGLLFGPMSDIYRGSTSSMRKASVDANGHSALGLIQDTVLYSSQFLSSAADATKSGGGSWSSTNGGNVLITSNFATTIERNADTAGNRKLTLAGDCATKLTNTYVFFLDTATNSLYRRTLTPTTGGICGTTPLGQKRTCAKGVANAVCQATDALISSNISGFTVNFYTTPNGSTVASPITVAPTAKITITSTEGSGNNRLQKTLTMRVTHYN